jgi:hypothetical protein
VNPAWTSLPSGLLSSQQKSVNYNSHADYSENCVVSAGATQVKFVFLAMTSFLTVFFLMTVSKKQCMCIEIWPNMCDDSRCGNVNSHWWLAL